MAIIKRDALVRENDGKLNVVALVYSSHPARAFGEQDTLGQVVFLPSPR